MDTNSSTLSCYALLTISVEADGHRGSLTALSSPATPVGPCPAHLLLPATPSSPLDSEVMLPRPLLPVASHLQATPYLHPDHGQLHQSPGWTAPVLRGSAPGWSMRCCAQQGSGPRKPGPEGQLSQQLRHLQGMQRQKACIRHH